MFLLTRKWYTTEYQFSKNRISNELNSIPNHLVPSKYQVRYDPRKVESSLIKLENFGFVKKCKNSENKKIAHRKPDYIYESMGFTELQPKIEQEFEKTRKDLLGLIGEMGNTEEDALFVRSQMREGSNGEE